MVGVYFKKHKTLFVSFIYATRAEFSSWMPQFDSIYLCTLTLFAITKVHMWSCSCSVWFSTGQDYKNRKWMAKKAQRKSRVEKCFVLERVMFTICQLFCQVWPVLVWMFDTSFVKRSIALYSRPLKMLFHVLFCFLKCVCLCVIVPSSFFLVTWGCFWACALVPLVSISDKTADSFPNAICYV